MRRLAGFVALSALGLAVGCQRKMSAEQMKGLNPEVVSPPAEDVLGLSARVPSRLLQSVVDRGRSHLKAQGVLPEADLNHSFDVRDVVVDKDGTEHVRFDRKYKGMRVLGGDLVVHSAQDGRLLGVDKTLSRTIELNGSDPISLSSAKEIALKFFQGKMTSVGEPERVVFALKEEPRLAYDVVVNGVLREEDPSELHVIVDAHSGSVIDSWEGVVTVAGTGNGFFTGTVPLETLFGQGKYSLKDPLRGNQATLDMGNKSAGSGTLMTDPDNLWGTSQLADRATLGVDAQFGAALTWDFFLTKFGRRGIRNDGVGANSRVHYGRRYNNAFWSDSCFCMTYGDGDGTTFNPFVSIDVAGHEMTHGVTSRTANLVYSGESGGLNEATSDIFGTLVEYFANNSVDVPDYQIGEKLYKAGNKALRYMYNPSLDGRSANCWSSTVSSLDVHYSSGVGNHFFYLLAEGSAPSGLPASPTCNSSTLSGIGRDAAGAIWYRALTVYMTSSTNYAGARVATLKAAVDLFGEGSAQVQAVAAAWSAVNVN